MALRKPMIHRWQRTALAMGGFILVILSNLILSYHRLIRSSFIIKEFSLSSRIDILHREQAMLKNSSLRFDWTDLPPMSPLGKIIEESQSQCLNATAVKLNGGPQEIVFSNIDAWPHGMGSALHTWLHPLCLASSEKKILVSGGGDWIWNDQLTCPQEFENAKVTKSTSAWRNQGNDSHSALWCYFGWHESGLRCPPGTIAWDKPRIDFGDDFLSYKCDTHREKYGKQAIRNAGIEWLFQNVLLLVIREAERQIREEAFPAHNNLTAKTITSTEKFQRWHLLPSADSGDYRQ